jgi:hypothetical protein
VWWGRSEPVEVYLSPTCLGVGGRGVAATAWQDAAGLDDALARLDAALRSPALGHRRGVRVWLASTLARPMIIGASAGARDAEEARALAAVRAPAGTGLDAAVRVWTSPWRSGRDLLAVAMPLAAWDGLERLVGSTDVGSQGGRRRLVSVKPWWNACFDAMIDESRREGASIGWSLREPDGTVHGALRAGEMADIAFDAASEHDPAATLLRRRLAVSWGEVESVRHHDFVRQDAADPGCPCAIGGWRGQEAAGGEEGA